MQYQKEEIVEQIFYTVRQVSERLGVHIQTVKGWLAKGWLIGHKIGGRVRIYESDLDAFLKRND